MCTVQLAWWSLSTVVLVICTVTSTAYVGEKEHILTTGGNDYTAHGGGPEVIDLNLEIVRVVYTDFIYFFAMTLDLFLRRRHETCRSSPWEVCMHCMLRYLVLFGTFGSFKNLVQFESLNSFVQ